MDKNIEILLNSYKNIESVDVDTYDKVSLENKASKILEYDVRNVMSATETFEIERQANAVYRIYGKIEYMSLLNGLVIKDSPNFNEFKDFFNPQFTGRTKNISNSFDFYLVRPSDGNYGNVLGSETEYVRYFKVMATPAEFELYPIGFANNVYGEQAYAFSFGIDFDVSDLYDDFGFPLTELFLYAQYKPRTESPPETLYRTRWTAWGVQSVTNFTPKDLNIGDVVETSTGVNIGELIDYVDTQYTQDVQVPQTFYIRTPYDNAPKFLEWKYNPFIPFRLQYLSNDIYQAKLSEVVGYTGTTLSVVPIASPSDSLYSRKYLSQYIDETKRTITNWSGGTTSTSYNWSNGILTISFPPTRTYKIRFEAQVGLTDGTNKYLVKTVIQEDAGSGWTDIPETDKLYQINNQRTIVEINRDYGYGDQIRMMVQLVPNTVPEDPTNYIPTYATILRNDGIMVWRNILDQGFTDPLTGVGVDYPFINKRRYLFSTVVLDVVPNLNETSYTLPAFQEVWFSDDAESIDITPTNDLDDIGKPCQ